MRRMFDEKEIKALGAESAVAEIAKGNVENAKPIYWHTIRFQRGGTPETSGYSRIAGNVIVLNNSPTPLTAAEFNVLLATPGFVAVVHSGIHNSVGAADMTGDFEPLLRIEYAEPGTFRAVYRDANNEEASTTMSLLPGQFGVFTDLGVNKIN